MNCALETPRTNEHSQFSNSAKRELIKVHFQRHRTFPVLLKHKSDLPSHSLDTGKIFQFNKKFAVFTICVRIARMSRSLFHYAHTAFVVLYSKPTFFNKQKGKKF